MRLLGVLAIAFGLYRYAMVLLVHEMPPLACLFDPAGTLNILVGVLLLIKRRKAVIFLRVLCVFEIALGIGLILGYVFEDRFAGGWLWPRILWIVFGGGVLWLSLVNSPTKQIPISKQIQAGTTCVVFIGMVIFMVFSLLKKLDCPQYCIVESPADSNWCAESRLFAWLDKSEDFTAVKRCWIFGRRQKFFNFGWDNVGRDAITCNWSKDGSLFIVSRLGQPVCFYDYTNDTVVRPDRPMPESSDKNTELLFNCDVDRNSTTVPADEFDRIIESRGGMGKQIQWPERSKDTRVIPWLITK